MVKALPLLRFVTHIWCLAEALTRLIWDTRKYIRNQSAPNDSDNSSDIKSNSSSNSNKSETASSTTQRLDATFQSD